MNRLFCTSVLLLCLVLTLGGCKTPIRFRNAPPFQSSYHLDEALLVAFPDELNGQTRRLKVGKAFWDQTIFIIQIREAYETETAGRMHGLFTKGVTITNHTFIREEMAKIRLRDEAMEEMTGYEVQEGDTPENRDLDTILNEMATTDEKFIKDNAGKLAGEALDESAREVYSQKDFGYLLYFEDAQLVFSPDRCYVSYKIKLVDWRTKNILLEKRYKGASATFTAFRNKKTNERYIQDHVRQAFNGTMLEMVDDIIKLSGAEGPRDP